MIRVARGEEPIELRKARWWRLARARDLYQREGRVDAKAFDGYRVAMEPLYHSQKHKCAFCEKRDWLKGFSVEHFHPKDAVDLIDWSALKPEATAVDRAAFAKGLPPRDLKVLRKVRHEGYWWMTWDWVNVLGSCAACNSGYKGTFFPLRREVVAATFESRIHNDGDVLLIDPTRVDPIDHIRFTKTRDYWRPGPRNQSALGAWTIAVFGLDDQDHLDEYNRQVELFEDSLRAVAEAVASEREVAVDRAWVELRLRALDPEQPYQGLLWDVIDQRFPLPVRTAWRLDHSRPHRDLPGDPPQADLAIVHGDGLDEETVWMVRALGENECPREQLCGALVALCRSAPRTRATLAEMVRRAEETLRPHLRSLTDGGRLRFDEATRCYHLAPPCLP